jgi:predicted Zn finger-like uncharacterized protein
MKLATRCASCGTVFRVVQDQLLVSEGWVRCGRCREVFNAIENMFELKKDVPSASVPFDNDGPSEGDHTGPVPATDPPSTQEVPSRRADTHQEAMHVRDRVRDRMRDPWLGQPTDQVVRTSLWPTSESPTADVPHQARDAAGVNADGPSHLSSDLDRHPRRGLDTDAGLPAFMARSQPMSAWQNPKVVIALRVAAGVLTCTLLAQWLLQNRDWVAARWPATESTLQALCEPLNCKIDAPRRLQALKVESATFQETNVPGHYRLAVSVRNADTVRVKMPTMDLRLTNARNDVLARRVLTAGEFDVKEATIAAGQDVVIQGLLRITQSNISGFDVTLFYP